jgi:hypothetical protein
MSVDCSAHMETLPSGWSVRRGTIWPFSAGLLRSFRSYHCFRSLGLTSFRSNRFSMHSTFQEVDRLIFVELRPCRRAPMKATMLAQLNLRGIQETLRVGDMMTCRDAILHRSQRASFPEPHDSSSGTSEFLEHNPSRWDLIV